MLKPTSIDAYLASVPDAQREALEKLRHQIRSIVPDCEECISYYGIAGPRGPQFHECGIRCKQGAPNDGCADGKKCTTISDGPGPVCR